MKTAAMTVISVTRQYGVTAVHVYETHHDSDTYDAES